jgi:putative transposase
MARGFVYLAAVVDWFSRRVMAWRVSITMDVDFCLEAVEEALARHGQPEIFNTDSKNDGVGSSSTIRSSTSDGLPENGRHSEVSQSP